MYKEALDNEVNINESNLFQREEFELCEDDVKRLTVLMDFDENSVNYPLSYVSMENISSNQSER